MREVSCFLGVRPGYARICAQRGWSFSLLLVVFIFVSFSPRCQIVLGVKLSAVSNGPRIVFSKEKSLPDNESFCVS